MEMNSRQLLVESRVDGIEDTLRSLKVRKNVCLFLQEFQFFYSLEIKALTSVASTLDPAFNEFGIRTGNDRPFNCPIICTDIYSQCYFVH